MLLLGPGKNRISQKIALAKFLFYVRSKKIFSPINRISQTLVIVLKNHSNEIRSNEICIRRELPVMLFSSGYYQLAASFGWSAFKYCMIVEKYLPWYTT